MHTSSAEDVRMVSEERGQGTENTARPMGAHAVRKKKAM
ncbi:hypothetical protein ANO14919_133010 [Xylariales sp. No.14919]|nr:hypothetical protein ANO14919_133010 [Xylariales sp. No.14919]